MQHTELIELFQRLLVTQTFPGVEREMAEFAKAEFQDNGFALTEDEAGNLYLRLQGAESRYPVAILGHLDEIGMVVKWVEDDGRLHLDPLSGTEPHRYGEGPMAIHGTKETVVGILSYGSAHAAAELERRGGAAKGHGWEDCWVETKRSRDELLAVGVRPGTRVSVVRERKQPVVLGDFITGYALDDKAAFPVLLQLARGLRDRELARDVVIGFTRAEEVGGIGAAWLTRELTPSLTIAVEIDSVVPEWGIENVAAPILSAGDFSSHYDVEVIEKLAAAAERRQIPIQYKARGLSGSNDAGFSSKLGHTARAASVGFPCENTHGWEIAHLGAIANIATILEEFLTTEI